MKINLDLPPLDKTIIIPTQALYGRDRIYIIKDQRLKAIQVKRLGLTNNGQFIIQSSDLKAGDKIAITPLPNARTGLLVDVRAE